MERQGIIAKVFPGIFLPFSLLPARKISPQHQTSTTLFQTCGRSRTTPPISPFLAHFPTSTPKPRAEGSSPSAPATKPAKTLGFRRFSFCMCCMVIVFTLVQTVGCRFRLHLSSSSFIPSSTQNTPDFGGFHLKSGAFHCFFLFWTCEIWGPVFVHCADMPHRLKPSVIPCRREVSFLT